ncbi:MAG TPA: hypothetical protein VIC53_04160, partial [Wenzhouxiangella sp.]
ADLGWMISNKPYMAGRSQFQLYGMHGWDPALAEMHGGFVMQGPKIVPGSQSPAIRSVDLYELMAYLLAIEPSENDGNLAPFMPYLNASEPVVYTTHRFDCEGSAVEARVAPMHMALHWEDEVHVLDRVESSTPNQPHQFQSVGLEFGFGDEGASVAIDDRFQANCVVAN